MGFAPQRFEVATKYLPQEETPPKDAAERVSEAEARKVTCYSGGEGRFMDWSQALRGTLLVPLLAAMDRIGMRANHLTFLSMVAGLLFCPLFLTGHPWWAYGALLLHVFLDGFDGPLARYQGKASDGGSFTDTVADQIVVTATAFAMVKAGHVELWIGGAYVFFYLMVVVFAMVRNALGTPYSWLFRPRFLVFIMFMIEAQWWPGSLQPVMAIATALLATKTFTGFLSIRRKLD